MGRRGVTYDEVARAADAIVGEGNQPSTTAVRVRLGGGSYTTIGAHLAKWREAQAERTAPHIQTSLPGDVALAVTKFMNGQLEALKSAFDATLAAERAAGASAEEEVEQLTEQLAFAQTQIGQLETQLGEASGRLKQAVEQAAAAHAALDTRLVQAERRATDAERIAAVAEARADAADRRAREAESREHDVRAELKLAVGKRTP
jgi:colicin import membrane protein